MVGRTLGPYRVLDEIGTGGMGVVYRAEDLRLGRQVALKFLNTTHRLDATAVRRFHREARAISALNHPGVCTIHEIGDDEGRPFLVMELLEGESLRQRLSRGPLKAADVLEAGTQIADALDAAHRHGIIHRDLTPANIFITERQTIKLLDFGLAKTIGDAAGNSAGGAAPRTASLVTDPERGIAGTLSYMSPEQVRGGAIDARTDLFSFGLVLYEMATGVSPFAGETTGVTLENVLTRSVVPPGLLNPDCPAGLDAIIGKALEKDRDLRYQSAREILVDLKRLKAPSDSARPFTVSANGSVRAGRFPRIAAVAVVAAAIAAPGYLLRDQLASWWPIRPVRLELDSIRQVTSLPGLEDTPTISPDGKFVVFSWQESEHADLWRKQIGGGPPVRLTDDPADDMEPDWSPDGSTIAFRSGRNGGGLYTMPAHGGDATPLAAFGFQPRWSPDGRRVLFQEFFGTLIPNRVFVVDYPNGRPVPLLPSEPDRSTSYRSADWSPDGRYVVAARGRTSHLSGLFIGPTSRGEGGHVLEWAGLQFRPSGATWAAHGRAVVLQSSPAGGPGTDAPTIGYVPLDRRLRASGPFKRLTTSTEVLGDVSSDGRILTYVGQRSDQTDIWRIAMNPATGLPVGRAERLTDSSANDRSPTVLPDNRHLVFLSGRQGGMALFVSDLDGQNVRLIDNSRVWRHITSVAADGTIGLWCSDNPKGQLETWILIIDLKTLQRRGQPRLVGRDLITGGLRADGSVLLGTDGPSLRGWRVRPGEDPVPLTWAFSPAVRSRYVDLAPPQFAFSDRWILFGAENPEGLSAVFAMRPDEAEPRLVWEGTYWHVPSSDPRRLYLWVPGRGGFTANWRLGFVEFDPDRGTRVSDLRLLPFEPGRGTLAVGHQGFSPDRRWFYFSWIEREGDVFIADIVVR